MWHLLHCDVGPGVVFAIDKVLHFVKLGEALQWAIDLERAVDCLPDGEVAIAEVLSIAAFDRI